MFRSWMALVAVLSSCAALAACGSSGDSSNAEETAASNSASTSATALTATEFVAQADAICKKAKEDYLGLVRQAGAAMAGGESQAKPLGEVADLFRSVQSDLAGLSPPADLTSTFDDYLNIKQDQTAAADDLAQAAAESTSAQITPEMKRLFDKVGNTGTEESAKLAAELGFRVCV